MWDQLRTVAAYVIALSVLMFGWTVFKAWEPPVRGRETFVTRTAAPTAPPITVVPTMVAAE